MSFEHMISVPRPLSFWANIDDARHIVTVMGLTTGPTPKCEILVEAQWGYKPENAFTVPLEDWTDLWVPE